MQRNNIYISGPMTGIRDYNRPLFKGVAESLMEIGYDVFNPADSGLPEHLQWSEYLRHDIASLMKCDAIYMLPGWEKSRGARLEHHIASELSMRIYYDPFIIATDEFPIIREER